MKWPSFYVQPDSNPCAIRIGWTDTADSSYGWKQLHAGSGYSIPMELFLGISGTPYKVAWFENDGTAGGRSHSIRFVKI